MCWAGRSILPFSSLPILLANCMLGMVYVLYLVSLYGAFRARSTAFRHCQDIRSSEPLYAPPLTVWEDVFFSRKNEF